MMKLPLVADRMFPRNTRRNIAWFWFRYWLWFILLLPLMLARQAALMAGQCITLACTWNRTFALMDGDLKLVFLNHWKAAAATIIWGERFLAIHYEDVLVDPGPVCTRRVVRRYVDRCPQPLDAVAATHWHEEHLGNVADLALRLNVPALGSACTLAAMRQPQRLSYPRRTLMGQPEPAVGGVRMQAIERELITTRTRLRVMHSPGHCRGHTCFYDPKRKLLIAGDAFMHTVFTSPNADVRCDD